MTDIERLQRAVASLAGELLDVRMVHVVYHGNDPTTVENFDDALWHLLEAAGSLEQVSGIEHPLILDPKHFDQLWPKSQ